MSNKPTYHNYTAADILSYKNGEMSAAEMHALEKAALSDPMLADAIEGFDMVSDDTIQKDLDWIQSKLQPVKPAVLPIKKYRTWRVAAILVLLGGIAAASFYLINQFSGNQVAQVNKKDSTATSTAPSETIAVAPTADTNALATLSPSNKKTSDREPVPSQKEVIVNARETPDLAKDQTAMVSPAPSTYFEKDVKDKMPSKSDDALAREDIQLKEAASQKAKSMPPALNNTQFLQNNFNGKVVDANNNPISGATVVVNNKALTTITNTQGTFQFLLADTQANVAIQSVGYATANIQLQPNNNNNPIVLLENNKGLSEVVVTSKNQPSGKEVRQARSKTMSDTIYNLIPEDGWDNYNFYLEKQLGKSSGNNTVDLVFDINAKGEPQHITIQKGSSKKLNAKASKLLQEGPAWKSADSSKIKKGFLRIRL